MDEGIKLRDRIYHISTGTVVLDSLLSGDDGAPLTSILVIDELKTCCFAKPLFRCFIAEGQDCKQSIFVASPSRKIAQNLVENIPSKILTTSLQDSSSAQANREETERMKIAWRYNTMPAVDSSISSLQNHKAINKVKR
jgi:elongator complex protein 4